MPLRLVSRIEADPVVDNRALTICPVDDTGDNHTTRLGVLMGVAGSGKSTVGEALSHALGWPFRDADSFHPPANVAKMSAGTRPEVTCGKV